MDLISLVLTLRPAAPPDPAQPLPLWWGRAAHALLLSTIRVADEALAQELHDESSPRPFTASTLVGGFKHGKLDPEGKSWLRLTGLTETVSAILFQAVQPGGRLAPGQSLELDYLPFIVQAAAWESDQHPWAGAADYADLAAQRLASSQTPERQVSLQFFSPTQFHSQDRTVPLPDLVFGSLAERWNAFAPLAFPPEVKRYAAECLAVSRFELSSRAVAMKGGGKRIGAVGRATYTALSYDRYWMSLVQTLATFARFAGVGAGVTMGLGQARLVELI